MNTYSTSYSSPSQGVSYSDGVATITTRTKQSMVNALVTARLTLEDDLPASLMDMKALAAGYLGMMTERDALRAELDAMPRTSTDVEKLATPPHGHRDDYYLMANARSLSMEPIHRIRSMPNWVLAKQLFATGSTSAHEICAGAGIDPNGFNVERATYQQAVKPAGSQR